MTYVISDIHGCYDQFMTLLQKIDFSDNDMLYVLGDVTDRGEHPCRVLQDMMMRTNVCPIMGNHDLLAAICLRALSKKITEETLAALDDVMIETIKEWISDGGETTLREFRGLSLDDRENILDYLGEFELFREVSVNGVDYILVHSGLGNFAQEKPLDAYSVEDIVLGRTDYSKQLFANKIIITGHTPTQLIPGNHNPGYIYKANNYIAIDCGCVFGGSLAALCLDTGEEFYAK